MLARKEKHNGNAMKWAGAHRDPKRGRDDRLGATCCSGTPVVTRNASQKDHNANEMKRAGVLRGPKG